MQVAERLLAAIAEPVDLGDGTLVTTVSIGIAGADDGDASAGELLRRADFAMYTAKDRGRARIESLRRARRADRPVPDARGRRSLRADGRPRRPSSRRRTRTTASARSAATAAAAPGGMLDASVGTPVDPMPDGRARRARRRRARRHRLPGHHRQPRASARPRSAWIDRRFGCPLTPDDVVACIGTKEVVASLPRVLSLRDPSRDTVLYPAVAYPTYEMGALARRAAARCRCRSTTTGTSTSAASIPPTPTARSCCGSTTRATPPARSRRPSAMVDAVEWARERGIIVASDECYAEFTYDADGAPAAPVTALARRQPTACSSSTRCRSARTWPGCGPGSSPATASSSATWARCASTAG